MEISKYLPKFVVNSYHFVLAWLGSFFYGNPSKKLKVIGITGTNGKSTVVEMTYAVLRQAGYKAAALSSIRFVINDQTQQNKTRLTMPGRFFVQKFLKQALDAGCQYVVLEVTSQGIEQSRHLFINFETVVFTNLSPEHIEAHNGFENYKKAKGKLFSACSNIHILNIDDRWSEYYLQFPTKEKIGFAINKNEFDGKLLKANNVVLDNNGKPSFNLNGTDIKLGLAGQFNVYNALACIAIAQTQGIDLAVCKTALEKIKSIPGRMEYVIEEPFKVVVDYAFTPPALESVYQTLKPQAKKLICVLGACGGGRDQWKRPVLGKIAGKHCDLIIVTNEDPYDEDPMTIINDVAEGAEKTSDVVLKKILDRREAIREALKNAQPGDAVAITGKGCEPSICVAGGKKIPWDDRQVVREEIK